MLTVVVPTYADRTPYLRRTLDHLACSNLKYPVLVSDSSEEPFSLSNKETVDKLSSKLNISYLRFASNIPPLLKHWEALQYINTKFVVFCGDDDFLIPSTLQTCVEFLEKNDGFTAVDGKEVRLSLEGDLQEISQNILALHHDQPEIDAEDPSTRLLRHYLRYWPTFYSVQRTSNLARNLRLAAENSDSILFSELIASGLTLIQGKYHYINKFYMVRQVFHDKSFRVPFWPELMRDANFKSSCDKLIMCLSQELVAASGSSLAQAEIIIRKAFNAYLRPYRISKVGRYFKGFWRLMKESPYIIINLFLKSGRRMLFQSPVSYFQALFHKRNLEQHRANFIELLKDPFYDGFVNIYDSFKKYPFGMN